MVKSYLTKQDTTAFKKRYEQMYGGQANFITDAFGKCRHEVFYLQMEGWCTAIDAATLPILFDWLQNTLIWIVQQIYNAQAWNHYGYGADEGRAIFAKVTDTITWAQSEIQSKVDGAKSYIQTNFITPIQNQINQQLTPLVNRLQNDLNNAQNALNSIKSGVDDAQAKAQSAISDASQAVQNAVEALNAVNNAKKTINFMLYDLEAKTNQIKSILNRLETLEKKQNTPIEPPQQGINLKKLLS